jgi:hypothetical protein
MFFVPNFSAVTTPEHRHSSALSEPSIAEEVNIEMNAGAVAAMGGLVCTDCGHPIDTNDFYEHDGNPYCEADYLRRYCSCTDCKLVFDFKPFCYLVDSFYIVCVTSE